VKQCSKCGIEKKEEKFNKQCNGKNGLRASCRDCTRKEHKIYNQTHKTNNANMYKSIKKYKMNNPEKIRAQNLLEYAVKKGRVKKERCKMCNAVNTEGHHDDYSKPYEVDWLCRQHHKERHWNNKHMENARFNDSKLYPASI